MNKLLTEDYRTVSTLPALPKTVNLTFQGTGRNLVENEDNVFTQNILFSALNAFF